MFTSFGKELRKLRIDNNEVLRDMAKRLGVTSSFLSAVEIGKKNVPNGWCEKIASEYNLNENQLSSLIDCAKESINSVKLSLSQMKEPQRKAALVFAREFNSISEETANKIIDLVTHNSDIQREE